MRYAKYHPNYSDNAPYFDAVAQAWQMHDPIHAPTRKPTDEREER
jgi:hypothetical protein